MRVNVISDLHLEFGSLELPGGDVLILAGDICEARSLKKDFHSTRPSPHISGFLTFYDFFYNECEKYDRVFYVMGNHEHYGARFDETQNMLKEYLPSHVQVLEKDHVEVGNYIFIGASLWTDCNRNNPLTINQLKFMMNDYRSIKYHNKEAGLYHKLTPEVTARDHRQALKYISATARAHSDRSVVVITHHGPSYRSVDDMYKHDYHSNGGYVSELDDFVLDHSNIKFWCHGHTHNRSDYQIGQCRVLCNPRGYKHYEPQASEFNPLVGFDI